MSEFKKVKNIFRIIEWIIAIIVALVFIDIIYATGHHVVDIQFENAAAYGYLIVTSLVFLALCLKETIPDKTGYAISGLGAFMYLVAGGVMANHFAERDIRYSRGSSGDGYVIRICVGIAFMFINGIVFLLDFILSLAASDFMNKSV